MSHSNCKFFDDTLHWNTYNFEPTPEIYEKLVKNRQNSNVKNFKIGLGDAIKEIEFVVYPKCGVLNTSLDKRDDNNFENKGDYYIIKVPIITYKKFIEDEKITKLDLFSLDVEEQEENVLKGMEGCNVLPDVFVIEGNHRTDFDKYNSYLYKMGYVFDLHLFCNYFYVKRDKLERFGLKEL